MGRNLEIKRPIQVSKYHPGDMGEDKGPLRLPGLLLLLPGQYLCASGFCISGACVAKFGHSRSSSMRALLHLTMDGTHTWWFPHSFHSPQAWLQISHPLSQGLPPRNGRVWDLEVLGVGDRDSAREQGRGRSQPEWKRGPISRR